MRLVVTADDLGIAPGVTRGILEAHGGGIVRSTSAIVTFASSEEGAATALAEPDLEVGLHLDLTGGRPVTDPAAIRSLVDAEGRFHPLREFTLRLVTGRIRSREVARELLGQIRRARSWGVPALAWDSHQHVHLMPPIAFVVASLAREHGARWIRRGRAARVRLSGKPLALHAATLVSDIAYRRIPGNHWYVDLTTHTPPLDATRIALLAALGGVGEISAHPGYVDEELARVDTLLHDRERDLALLTAPLLRQALGTDGSSWRVV